MASSRDRRWLGRADWRPGTTWSRRGTRRHRPCSASRWEARSRRSKRRPDTRCGPTACTSTTREQKGSCASSCSPPSSPPTTAPPAADARTVAIEPSVERALGSRLLRSRAAMRVLNYHGVSRPIDDDGHLGYLFTDLSDFAEQLALLEKIAT